MFFLQVHLGPSDTDLHLTSRVDQVLFDSELRGWFLSYLETRIVTTLFEAKNT